MASILVCDDQRSICEMLDISLRKDGHRVETVNGGEAAKRNLAPPTMSFSSPISRCRRLTALKCCVLPARHASPETSVILITAVEDYEAAVQAVKGGAFDYIHKGPGLLEELKLAVGRALETLASSGKTLPLSATPPAATRSITLSAAARSSKN